MGNNQEEITNEIYHYAAELLIQQKKSPDEVKDYLIQQGLNTRSAENVVESIRNQVNKRKEKDHKKQLLKKGNKELWNKILQFDFDNSLAAYGFSTRLENENLWTKNFTEQAILEYKKFMYLAATSNLMVSPSEIVDIVWHQHLIFTQSYQDFCDLIGKQVHHVPSTHNKDENEKFKEAKEWTKKHYTENFSDQPKAIWDYTTMYEGLDLDKSGDKLKNLIIIGVLIFIVLIIPFYFILEPIYITIDNPYFIIGFIGLTLVTFTGLEFFNRKKLNQIIKSFGENSFVHNLHPLELIYLKTQKISNVISGIMNELLVNETITINALKISLLESKTIESTEQFQAVEIINSLGEEFYPKILEQLTIKPIFLNIVNSMNTFKKYFNESEKFSRLFYLNFIVLAALLMSGFIRLATGVLKDKPITQIAISVAILTILIIVYLYRLTKLVYTKTIPNLYKNEILPTQLIENNSQWEYFLLGSAVIDTSFLPLVNYVKKENYYGSKYGSSCGASGTSGGFFGGGDGGSFGCGGGGGCGGCGGGGCGG